MTPYNFDELMNKSLTDIERDIKTISKSIDSLDKQSKDYLSEVKTYTKMLDNILEKQIANMNMAVNGHTLQNRVVIINGVETWIAKQQGLGSKIPDSKNKMLNCYSTEMFELMVKGEKIAVFCSMINRIKFAYGLKTCWDYQDKTNYMPSVEDIENIVNGNSIDNKPTSFIVEGSSIDLWKEKFIDWKINNKNILYKKNGKRKSVEEIKLLFVQYYQRFKDIHSEKEVKDVFKLKQTFMIKIL